MAEPVLSKRYFVRRFQRNEFGNKTFNWDTFEEFLDSGYTGLVHIRSRTPGGFGMYNVHSGQVGFELDRLQLAGHLRKGFYFASMSPDCTVFQGEIADGIWGYDLTYSLLNLPMRDALKQQTLYAKGLKAKLLMEYFLDPGDWDWIQELLQSYPGHVVEFSHYQIPCGTLSRNLIVWEVRKY